MSSTRGVAARYATLAMAAAAFAVLTVTTVATAETTEIEAVAKLPDLGPYEHCAFEGSTCSCNGEARFGYTGGDAGNGTNWTLAPSHCTSFVCGAASFNGAPEGPGPAGSKMIGGFAFVDVSYVKGTCQCATTVPPPPVKNSELVWKWCASAGGECPCEGRLRFGHTGFKEHYADNSQFFKQNKELVRWVYEDVPKGKYPCTDERVKTTTPWVGDDAMEDKLYCQCAALPPQPPKCELPPPSPENPSPPPPAPPPPPTPPSVPEPPATPVPDKKPSAAPVEAVDAATEATEAANSTVAEAAAAAAARAEDKARAARAQEAAEKQAIVDAAARRAAAVRERRAKRRAMRAARAKAEGREDVDDEDDIADDAEISAADAAHAEAASAAEAAHAKVAADKAAAKEEAAAAAAVAAKKEAVAKAAAKATAARKAAEAKVAEKQAEADAAARRAAAVRERRAKRRARRAARAKAEGREDVDDEEDVADDAEIRAADAAHAEATSEANAASAEAARHYVESFAKHIKKMDGAKRHDDDVTEDAAIADKMEAISVDTLPGTKSWDIEWKFCANQGEECKCPGSVRYGHAGMMEHYENGGTYFHDHPNTVRWMMRETPKGRSSIVCELANFADRDPFPAIPREKKKCQCAAKAKLSDLKITGLNWGVRPGSIAGFFEAQHPATNLFKTCAKNGGRCECDGAVRFGEPAHALHAGAFSQFWEEIINQPQKVHDIEGKWYILGGVKGGVDCKRTSFERPSNANRIAQNDHDETICQCLQGDDYYKAGDVTEVQLLSLADLPENSPPMAALAAAYLLADEKMARYPELAALGASFGGDVDVDRSSLLRRVPAGAAAGAAAVFAAAAGFIAWRRLSRDGDEDELEPLISPA